MMKISGEYIELIKLLKFSGLVDNGDVAKAVVEELMAMGKLPDDRYGEIVREVGGKGLQKKIREKIAPKMEKIDPNLKTIIEKVRKGSKKQDKDNK